MKRESWSQGFCHLKGLMYKVFFFHSAAVKINCVRSWKKHIFPTSFQCDYFLWKLTHSSWNNTPISMVKGLALFPWSQTKAGGNVCSREAGCTQDTWGHSQSPETDTYNIFDIPTLFCLPSNFHNAPVVPFLLPARNVVTHPSSGTSWLFSYFSFCSSSSLFSYHRPFLDAILQP